MASGLQGAFERVGVCQEMKPRQSNFIMMPVTLSLLQTAPRGGGKFVFLLCFFQLDIQK